LSWRGLKVWFIPLKEFMVYSIEGVSKVAVDFYKDLFGFEQTLDINSEDFSWDESERDTDFENDFLCCQITERDKTSCLESYAGPPAPDFFYVLSIAVVRCFEKGEFDVIRLNYAMLTLIHKEPDVKHLKYRSISLLNCSLKIITWILTEAE
jgi:hypothetical protein